MKHFIFALLGAGVIVVALYYRQKSETATEKNLELNSASRVLKAQDEAYRPKLTYPVERGSERVAKKFFGTFVSPERSPISPERFYGYHAGVDFETFPEEQTKDVWVYAACGGSLILKKQAPGYGGVAAQSCALDDEPVTIVYGHLRLASISLALGSALERGDKIGALGTGYSAETDGERKHLHFAIHSGGAINLLGYVRQKEDLGAWKNPLKYLR